MWRNYLKYWHKGDTDICPKCGAKLCWVYDGFYWYACDAEPVYYVRDYDSRVCVVKHRNLLTGCRVNLTADEVSGARQGLLPHCYSCGVERN